MPFQHVENRAPFAVVAFSINAISFPSSERTGEPFSVPAEDEALYSKRALGLEPVQNAEPPAVVA